MRTKHQITQSTPEGTYTYAYTVEQDKAYPKGKNIITYQGREITVSPMGRKIYCILLSGLKYSHVSLIIRTYSSDPRREMRRLREKGINIHDEWVAATPTRTRHKRFFLPSTLRC